MRRTGIDLSSIRCNLVDAESSGRRRRGEPNTFRVHDFASITHLDNGEALTGELKTLAARGSFSRRAWVNLWDVRSSHQYVLLPSAPDAELESRARRQGASALGMNELDVTVSAVIGGARGEPGHHPKREVSFFAAGSDDIHARLKPIVEAGFVVEGVTTPCGALWSQARLRRPSLPGQVHAHAVIGVSQSALGIFGDGALLYARDLDWGYRASSVGTTAAQDRELLADRLSMELRRSFLYLKQYWEEDVSQVLLCGDMPEIRSLTAPLIERLNIEVETLDTLEGIDGSTLPDGFGERASTLRLASSIAVEPPPVNLLPVDVTASRTNRSGRMIVVGGTAAAVALGAFLYGQASVSRTNAERQRDAARRAMSSFIASAEAGDARVVTTSTQGADSDAPGPAMARVLETIAHAAPPAVALRSLRGSRDGSHWNISVNAHAAGSDEAAARKAADRFLRALSALGEPLQPPTIRFLPETGGVELAATYRVRS